MKDINLYGRNLRKRLERLLEMVEQENVSDEIKSLIAEIDESKNNYDKRLERMMRLAGIPGK